MNIANQDTPAFRFVAAGPRSLPRRTVLRTAKAHSETDLLVDADGAPVWPIRSPGEEQVLDRIARVFGGETESMEAQPASAPAEALRGSVVGIGDLEEEVSLYAHLTGRYGEVRVAEDELNPDALPDVVLYCGSRLSRELVQALLLAPAQKTPVGIIWGRSRAELRLRLLSSACAAYLNGPVQVAELSISEAGLGDGAEGQEPVDSLRRRMGEGVGVLRVRGHSDGLFNWLGHGAALCPRGAEPEAGDRNAAPQCVTTNFCHRLNEPLETVSREGRLISPATVSARVLIHLSCQSAFLGCSSIDSAWGLLPGLASNPYIGALIATPSLALNFEEVLGRELEQFLKDGFAVGEAMAKLQENPTIREVGYRPLLFGDPMVRAGSGSASTLRRRDALTRQQSSASSPLLPVGAPNDSRASELELIRRLSQVVPASNPVAAKTSESLRLQIQRYEYAEDDDVSLQEAELRNALLRHLAGTKVRLYEGWQGTAHVEELEDVEACPNCSWTGKPKFITLPAGGEREAFDCPSCGDVLDQPVEDDRLEMNVDSSAFSLSSEVDRERAAAAVYVVRLEPSETQTLAWPWEDAGLLGSHMTVDLEALEQGPVKIYAVLVQGLSLYSRAFRTRGSSLSRLS